MQTVAIVGVGLIGGSFALALKKAGFGGTIIGVSSPETLRQAIARGVIHEAAPLEPAIQRADLIYLAQPIARILKTLTLIDPWLRPGALVTDAGSTKVRIVAEAQRSVRGAQFLGGHPMAGKESRGVESADAELFAGRTYMLTPANPGEMETPAARTFIDIIRRIGAWPVALSAEDHDRLVSFTSHLPQLASTALASVVAGHMKKPNDRLAAGPGLADTTRLALSPYEIWRDILDTNTEPVRAALSAYIRQLELMRENLSGPEVERLFQEGAAFRGLLGEPKSKLD